MTSERRRSIIILVSTLIVGILLGLLIPGFYFKMATRGGPPDRGHEPDKQHKKEMFVGMLNRIIKPDSNQARQLKPITDWAANQIDTVEMVANRRMGEIFDSLKSQLTPILTPEQLNRLEDFDRDAKEKWRPRRDRRR